MTGEQVRGLIGPPGRISRQILAHRQMEQWHYDQPHHLRLTFDSPRGQSPRLLSIRSSTSPAP
jgi:hypothetical protein